ncbi:MAG: SH3 domain-containing protein [Flavobacteriales bacterium]|nr:SH3 domain-containing protein [Flavobacteriales bacterium]
MKRYFFFLISIAFLTCCGDSTPESEAPEASEEAGMADSTITTEETQTEEWKTSDTLVPFERHEYVQSNFTSPQIDFRFQYLYYKDELNIYEDLEMLNSIGVIKKGEKVEVIEEVGGRYVDDEGFPGYITKVKTGNGTEGFIYNNYLIPLPYPQEDLTYPLLNNYALTNFHIEDSVLQKGAFFGDQAIGYESEWSENYYTFESGIKLSDSEAYETISRTLFVPRLNGIQGLFFLDALNNEFDLVEFTGGFPDGEFKEFEIEKWGYSSLESKLNPDSIHPAVESIDFYFGDGCGEWYSVLVTEEGVKLEIGGGC